MNAIYVIIAYRWNDSERHSYLVGTHFDLEKAKEIAEKEADCRGGKYSVRVYKCSTCCEWSEEMEQPELVHTAAGIIIEVKNAPLNKK